jgi:two-component system, sensor histidine kinase and response regulator
VLSEKNLQKELDALKAKLLQKDKVISDLKQRVEKSSPASGNAFPFFENNILLPEEVASKTERMQAAIKLARASNKAKSNFLANMSHEIRTPMNSIIGLTQLTLGTDLNSEQYDFVQKINQSAKTLRAIIDDILDFSKIEAGKLHLEKIPFQLTEAIEHASTMISENVSEKGLHLKIEIDPELDRTLVGDPLRLKQILINLLSNAVKFTEQGEILVLARKVISEDAQTTVQFTVKDTGIGMSALTQRTIFQFFRQADISISRKYGGTGLGLAISKALIHMMGGEISVSSTLDKGTEFCFSLNFECPETTDSLVDILCKQDSGVSLSDLKKLKGARILLVEDNTINQDVAIAILAQKEIETRIAENGQQALNILETEQFDCVLMDIQMPVMDGYAATKAIRQDERFKGLPILAMTANALVSDEKLSLEAGMNSHISKPIDMNILFRELVQWIDTDKVLSRNQTDTDSASEQPYSFTKRNESDVMDVEASLKRVGGNRDLYIKILKAFVGKHAGDHTLIVDFIAQNNIKEAQNVTHSLKGVAQIVGSNELYDIVTKLDHSLDDGKSSQYQELLMDFKVILGNVIQSIEMFFSKTQMVDAEESLINAGNDSSL